IDAAAASAGALRLAGSRESPPNPRSDFSKSGSMIRPLLVSSMVVLAGVALAAQSPKGWKVRPDRSTNASDPDAAGTIQFVTSGSGYHVTAPQAAVFWH